MDLTTRPVDLQILHLDESKLLEAQQLFILLHEVFGEAGSLTVSNGYIKKLLQKTDFIIFAAMYQNRVVGGFTACLLPVYNSESPVAYICDIAVHPAFQRQGIGQKLMAAARVFFAGNGVSEMFVQANEEDAHALDFYRPGSIREEQVRQFTYKIT